MSDLQVREMVIAVSLSVMILWIGLYPAPFLRIMNGSVQALVDRSGSRRRSGSARQPIERRGLGHAMGEYALLYILFAPFAGAFALIFVSNRQPLLVRGIAAGAAFVSLLASLYLFYAYDPVQGGFQFVQQYEWSRQLGISLHLGVDGIGTPLVLASSILLFAGIFVSWHIKDRTKEFYIWLLILAAATIGVFMSLDLSSSISSTRCPSSRCTCLLGMWGSHTKKYLEMTDPDRDETAGLGRFYPQFRLEQQRIRGDETRALPVRVCGRRAHGHFTDL